MKKVFFIATANFLGGCATTLSILHLCGFAINPIIGFGCAIASFKS